LLMVLRGREKTRAYLVRLNSEPPPSRASAAAPGIRSRGWRPGIHGVRLNFETAVERSPDNAKRFAAITALLPPVDLVNSGGQGDGADHHKKIGGKWLDLLKQIAPATARVAVVFNPELSPQSKFHLSSIEKGACLSCTLSVA
jgi:hypothetical protein